MSAAETAEWRNHPEYLEYIVKLRRQGVPVKDLLSKLEKKFPRGVFTEDAVSSYVSRQKSYIDEQLAKPVTGASVAGNTSSRGNGAKGGANNNVAARDDDSDSDSVDFKGGKQDAKKKACLADLKLDLANTCLEIEEMIIALDALKIKKDAIVSRIKSVNQS
jgi:hypothetical protein